MGLITLGISLLAVAALWFGNYIADAWYSDGGWDD